MRQCNMSKQNFNLKQNKCYRLICAYCTASTLHGIKYIGELSRPIFERILWLVVLGFSLYGVNKFTFQVWDKWQNHPVIVSLADKTTSISKVPFPAITLCPTESFKSELFNEGNISNIGAENMTSFGINRQEFDFVMKEFCERSDYENASETTFSPKLVSVLKKIKPNFEDVFKECIWKGKVHSCRSLWFETITSQGICYTFNSLGNEKILRDDMFHADFVAEPTNMSSNWDTEEGYQTKQSHEMIYPRRVLSAGFEIGLSLHLLGTEEVASVICEEFFPGFAIYFHAPNEYPNADKNFVRVSFGQEILISVRPNLRITSSKLKDYAPKKRQCYFNNEKYLKYFKLYTENNCEMECYSNYTQRICNCSQFYIPSINLCSILENVFLILLHEGHEHTPVCKIKDEVCTEEALKEMLIAENSEMAECHCMPGCTKLDFDTEVSFSELYVPKSGRENLNNLTAEVVIFFKEDQFWISKRSNTYGKTEFLANVGGVLGLMMGFSVLSLVEIVYFIIFRFCRLIRD